MRLIRIVFISITMAALAAPVWAQYGLYGSPDPMPAPAAQPYYTPTGGTETANASQPAYAPQLVASRPTPAYVTPNPPYQSGYGNQMAYQNQNAPAGGQTVPAPAMPAPPAAPTPVLSGAAPAPANNAPVQKGLMSQMLSEQGQAGGQVNSAGTGGCLNGQTSACGVAGNPACGGTSGWLSVSEGFCPWYGSVSALVMSRDEPNRVWTSSEDGNDFHQITNTQDCKSSWKWGGEVRFGRRFCLGNRCDPCCDPSNYWAVEATYWTLDRFSGFNDTTHVNGLNTPLTFFPVTFNDGTVPAVDFFNGAEHHYLWRTNEIHNVELSVLYGRWANAAGCPWDFAWSVGPRYFRFDETLTFGSAPQNGFLRNHVLNNLFGCQVGGDIGYNLGSNFRLYAMPKAGLYGNLITNQCDLYAIDPITSVRTDADQFPTHASTSQASLLMQIDVGAEWFFAKNWSLRAGYRVVAVSGVGLADNQMWPYVWDAGRGEINSNGDLILHGGVVSLGFNF
jgi:hypothetical protein